MEDAGLAINKALYLLLKGLIYNDKEVHFYTIMPPSNAEAPYVNMGPWVGRKNNTKDSFGQKGVINLDVVTRFTGGAYSLLPSGEIAKLITERLTPIITNEATLDTPGFSIWQTTIDDVRVLSQNTSTDVIIRKIIAISFFVCQLP